VRGTRRTSDPAAAASTTTNDTGSGDISRRQRVAGTNSNTQKREDTIVSVILETNFRPPTKRAIGRGQGASLTWMMNKLSLLHSD
jgi:hypothetical protein